MKSRDDEIESCDVLIENLILVDCSHFEVFVVKLDEIDLILILLVEDRVQISQ